MDHLCFLCHVLCFSCCRVCSLLPCGHLLGKALFGDVYCIFVTFPCGILGKLWYLIVSFPDLCRLSYIHWRSSHNVVTHVRNRNSNIQGRSPYTVKVFFYLIRNCF